MVSVKEEEFPIYPFWIVGNFALFSNQHLDSIYWSFFCVQDSNR